MKYKILSLLSFAFLSQQAFAIPAPTQCPDAEAIKSTFCSGSDHTFMFVSDDQHLAYGVGYYDTYNTDRNWVVGIDNFTTTTDNAVTLAKQAMQTLNGSPIPIYDDSHPEIHIYECTYNISGDYHVYVSTSDSINNFDNVTTQEARASFNHAFKHYSIISR